VKRNILELADPAHGYLQVRASNLVEGQQLLTVDYASGAVLSIERHPLVVFETDDKAKYEENRAAFADLQADWNSDEYRQWCWLATPNASFWGEWVDVTVCADGTTTTLLVTGAHVFLTPAEHRAVCTTCHKPWPCPEHVIQSTAARLVADAELVMRMGCKHCDGIQGQKVSVAPGYMYHYYALSNSKYRACRKAAEAHAERLGKKIITNRWGGYQAVPVDDMTVEEG
jgi:Pyruvate/2-oxoacid:ferredoxin oxidoreductase delta subunit